MDGGRKAVIPAGGVVSTQERLTRVYRETDRTSHEVPLLCSISLTIKQSRTAFSWLLVGHDNAKRELRP
jgi:hypothetical protein